MITDLKGQKLKKISYTWLGDNEFILIETDKGTYALKGTNPNANINFEARPYNVDCSIEGCRFEILTNQLAVIMLATTKDVFTFKLSVPYPEVLNRNNLFTLMKWS